MNEYYILITYTTYTYTHTNIYTQIFYVHLLKIKQRIYYYIKTKKTQQLFSFFFIIFVWLAKHLAHTPATQSSSC